MKSSVILYLCSMCFEVSETAGVHHGRPMIRCDVGSLGDERRKPLVDGEGHLKSHAPRWFLEAIGSLPTQPAHRAAHGAAHA